MFVVTHVSGITRCASYRCRSGDGFDTRAEDDKNSAAMLDVQSMRKENACAQNRRNYLPCRYRTFRQRSCNQRVDCLLRSEVRIYEGDGSKDLRKVRSKGVHRDVHGKILRGALVV